MMARLFNLTLDEMFNLIAREVEKKKPSNHPPTPL
jgi:hypothetical protein